MTKADGGVLLGSELVAGILARMAADVSLIIDREFTLELVHLEVQNQRPVGEGHVHISFKLGLDFGPESGQGCLLVPLPDAIALGGFMMMLEDEQVTGERGRTDLDEPFKEALLEVGKYLAGACDAVLRQAFQGEGSSWSDGCQGVRASVRPALSYREGDPLLVARARARVHEFPSCDLILVLPGSMTAETLST